MEACPSIDFDVFNEVNFPEFSGLFSVAMVPEGSFAFGAASFDGAITTPPPSDDCHSSLDDGGSDSGYHSNAFCQTDVGAPRVAQCDLDALSSIGDQPQHTHVKKMKKANLAAMTEEERVVRRRTKNREAAALSRERKRSRLEELEKQVERQRKLNATLVHERALMRNETTRLRGEVEYLKSILSNVAQCYGSPKVDAVDPPMSPFLLSVH